MDVNASPDVKVYGVPAVSTAEIEDAEKPPVQPVPESGEGSTVDLNEQALHGKNAKEEQSQGELTREDIEEAVEEIQQRLESMGSSFKFGLHQHLQSESIVAQLRDKNTEEVIKQFPSEEVLKLRAKLKDLIGLLFDEKV